MWRALFIGIGLTALILGAECMVVERATVTLPVKQDEAKAGVVGSVEQSMRTKTFALPEWAPWTLLSTGAVVVLYGLTAGKE